MIALDTSMQPTTDMPDPAGRDGARLEHEGPPPRPNRPSLDLVPERLYKIARAGVYRTLGHSVSRSEPEDLVQEVLERVLRSLREGRFAGDCSLSTWVTAIAQHVARDELRAAARKGDTGVALPAARAETAIDLEHQLEARGMLEQVQRLLEQMPAAAARVVILHDLVGHDLAEVAALTGLSLTAAQSRLVRGRRAIERGLTGGPDRRRRRALQLNRRPDSACDESAPSSKVRPREVALGSCSLCKHVERANQGHAPSHQRNMGHCVQTTGVGSSSGRSNAK